MKNILLLILFSLFLSGCPATPEREGKSTMTYFIGVDVSGSFRPTETFQDSLEFLAYYIYTHIHGLDNLKKAKALFVGTIGGNYEDDTQVFRSLYDFENKNVQEIHQDLKNWFGEKDRLTDFNTFFASISQLIKKRNLTLSPITILVISDGIPEGTNIKIGDAGKKSYSKIDLSPLDYLARNVTVRLLYSAPKVAKNWEDYAPRKRVRLWTAADEVMKGWRSQLVPGTPIEEQTKFFEWLQYNVDYRVKVKKF